MLYTQLRSFHAVATEGGFTAASKVLNVGQPTITSQVRELEDYFKIELFHRRGRSVSLTEAGEGLFAITKRMMSQEREAIDYLNALSGFHTGHLRLGAVGPYNVTEMLSAFSERYPDLEMTVRLGNSHEMLERLLDFSVDVAVLAQVEDDPRFHSIPFSTDEIVALMHRDHPLASRDHLPLKDLMAERLVLREEGSTTRRAMERAWNEAALQPDRVIEMGSREAVWIAVLRKLGVGFVSEAELIEHSELVTRHIGVGHIKTTDHVVCLSERREARIVRAFLGVVGQIIERRLRRV